MALQLVRDFLAAGHDVDLVLMEAKGELLALVPAPVHVVDLKAARIRSAITPLIRYLRARRPHALQVSMWPLTVIGIIAHRLARSKARMVTSDHAALSKHYPAANRAVFQLLVWTIRLFYPLADARILVSRDAAEDMARFSGMDRSAFQVIYNPIEAPGVVPVATAEVEALWPAGGGARIITVGTLKAQKNHALLIRAIALLNQQRPASLMILGEGDLREDLEELAAKLGISERVMMPGFHTDPWPFYASAQLFVLSSDYEGFGNVLVEAMYCGLPVVSTDCEAGPREILDGGRFGRLVPCGDVQALADAMLEALGESSSANALKGRAEEISGKATTSNRYLELMIETDPARDRAQPQQAQSI